MPTIEIKPDIPCVDVWGIDKLRETALQAYLLLEADDGIRIQYPVVVDMRANNLTIRYNALVSQRHARERLKALEREIAETDARDGAQKEVSV
jgi:hypothetical protein